MLQQRELAFQRNKSVVSRHIVHRYKVSAASTVLLPDTKTVCAWLTKQETLSRSLMFRVCLNCLWLSNEAASLDVRSRSMSLSCSWFLSTVNTCESSLLFNTSSKYLTSRLRSPPTIALIMEHLADFAAAMSAMRYSVSSSFRC